MPDKSGLDTDFTISDALKRAKRRKAQLESIDRELSDVDALSRELEDAGESDEIRDIFQK